MNAREAAPVEQLESSRSAPPAAGTTPATPPAPAPRGNPARKRALLGVTAVVALAAIVYGIYYALVLNHYESTDDAYVQGNVVQLTPQAGGTVVAINAEDTDFVKAGQPLVRLDPADARVALEQADAQLGQAVREVRTLFVNNGALNAQIASRQADIARAQSEVARAQDDVNRRAPLVATGAVGREEFNHATAQLAAAKSALAAAQSAAVAAREQLASNQSLTEGISVEDHPSVQRAAARVREAYLGVARAELVAPVDGYVARRSVQLGQRVQPGAPLMSIVALNQVWVDANFKEGQLRSLRIGQPVTLEADVYGKKVEYHGRVEGLGAGTGSAFALLPAQNATGNWIKVVQRVPVRIALDPKELEAHPLRVGLSMDARVDVSRTDGSVLATAPRPSSVAQTDVFDRVNDKADAEVRRVIAANLGRATRTARTANPAGSPTSAAPGVPGADDSIANASASASAGVGAAPEPVLARRR
ncbi:MAG: HlyD family efflux transporter periplasmic adaptor subunit [Rhizobacter sp.]